MDWQKVLDFLTEVVTSLGLKLLVGLLVLAVGLFAVKKLRKFIRYSKRLNKMDVSLRTFLASFFSILGYVVLFLTLASILGVPVTSFLTVLASCGVAVGLAMQGSLSNLAGGVMLLLFRPFRVEDYIRAAGDEGTVKEINVFYTVLLTLDNKRITIPNGTLMGSVIENYSAEEMRRVDLVVHTAYSAPIERTKEVLLAAALENERVQKDPAPFVGVVEYADSALKYTLRSWCKKEDYWDVYFDLTERVKNTLDREGIEIPFSQVDVRIREN